MDLLYRIVYNEQFITKTLDYQETDVDKDKALKCAFDQYEISGSKKFPMTSEAQKIHIHSKFAKNDFGEACSAIAEDVNSHLQNVKSDPNYLHFPNETVQNSYNEEFIKLTKREKKINADFAKVINNKQFLELVDAYRQFAIDDVVQGGGTFDEKKTKIENIFEKTKVEFDDQNFVMNAYDQDKANSLKTSIIEDPKFAVNTENPPFFQTSLTEYQLLKRILYNELFIHKTLNQQGKAEDEKEMALKSAIKMYKITGDNLKYLKTFSKQRDYIDKITNLKEININGQKNRIFRALIKSGLRDFETCFKSGGQLFAYNSSVSRVYEQERADLEKFKVASAPVSLRSGVSILANGERSR
jgi:hypothetical protein